MHHYIIPWEFRYISFFYIFSRILREITFDGAAEKIHLPRWQQRDIKGNTI